MAVSGSRGSSRAAAQPADEAESRLKAWDIQAGRDYLRARTLADGPEVSPRGVIEALIEATEAEIGAGGFAALTARAEAGRARLGIVALNAAALIALRRAEWDRAELLAGEVVARDHHDLLAQALLDAARARSASLERELDRWLADRFCAAPFQQIETRTTGAVHFCCSAWQPAPIGNLTDGSDGFWNSARAQEIRRSIHDGDFAHCSRWHCPKIAARSLPRREEVAAGAAGTALAAIAATRITRLDRPPARVILSHDRSCNIACPSCRDRVIQIGHAASDALDALFDRALLPLVAQARAIKVTGSGDPFGSRHFRYVLRRLTSAGQAPARRLQLHTNGLLCDARAWRDLGLRDHVDSVWVSVDAARPETYAVLRRGGDFDVLRRNLDFLGALRRAGGFNALRLDFVVQRRNYDEMGELVDLARGIGADGVYFLRLRNWGHTPPDAFRARDVCDPSHPEHAALLAVLADPRMRAPGVELGTLAELAATTGAPEAVMISRRASRLRNRAGAGRLTDRTQPEGDPMADQDAMTPDDPKRDQAAAAGANTEKHPDDWVTGDEPMTGAQASYLKTLSEEAGEAFDPGLSKGAASKRIDDLRSRNPRVKDA